MQLQLVFSLHTVGVPYCFKLILIVLCRRFELERPGVGPCSRGADLGKGGNLFFFCPFVCGSMFVAGLSIKMF